METSTLASLVKALPAVPLRDLLEDALKNPRTGELAERFAANFAAMPAVGHGVWQDTKLFLHYKIEPDGPERCLAGDIWTSGRDAGGYYEFLYRDGSGLFFRYSLAVPWGGFDGAGRNVFPDLAFKPCRARKVTRGKTIHRLAD